LIISLTIERLTHVYTRPACVQW